MGILEGVCARWESRTSDEWYASYRLPPPQSLDIGSAADIMIGGRRRIAVFTPYTPPGGTIIPILLFVGLVLTIIGLRGKRIGDDPHCRKCGYNLNGLTGTRCPECGASFADGRVKIGIRRRRFVPLVLGLCLLLLSFAGQGSRMYVDAKGVNWFRFYPTVSLVRHAVEGDRLAHQELEKRVEKDLVRAQDLDAIINAALERQKAYINNRAFGRWTYLLAMLEDKGRLSDTQRNQFFDRLISAEMKLRPLIREDEPLVAVLTVRILGEDRVPYDFSIASMQLNGAGKRLSWEWDARLWPGRYVVRDHHLPPGPNSITCNLAINLYAPFNVPDVSPPDYVKEHVLLGEVTVVPSIQPSPVAVVTNESIERQLANHLIAECGDFSFISLAGQAETESSCHLSLEKAVEISLCMDLFIEDRDKDIHLWPMIWRKNETHDEHWHIDLADWGIDLRQNADLTGMTIVLRPNRDLALTTLEIFDMWGTEIRCYLPPLSDEMQRARVEVSGFE